MEKFFSFFKMPRLLRVLCLHGYAQNASIMKKHLAKWQAALADKVEFVFASGPLLAVVSDELREQQAKLGAKRGFEPLKAWARFADEKVVGFSESLGQVQNFVAKEGPFDGVMGFSQGALVAGSLVHLNYVNNNSISHPISLPKFQFAILVSGFIFKNSIIDKLFHSSVSIPSLHIISQHDNEVPPESSHELSGYFQRPDIIVHDKGHLIPDHPEVIDALKTFFNKLPCELSSSQNKSKL